MISPNINRFFYSCSCRRDAATTGIRPSSSVVAVAEETRLLSAFGSLMIVAVVKETWLLPAFGSLHCELKKPDTKFLPITSPNINRFLNYLTVRLRRKF